VRAGGKHNDLENVGHTARHHTFFEMLGNFSFGDYFKPGGDRVRLGVGHKRRVAGHPSRSPLHQRAPPVTRRAQWRRIAGIGDERIYGLPDTDNFWQMGDTGPAGPCSEIFVDLRDRRERGDGAPSLEQFVSLQDRDQVTEIWNLVFMQYDLQADGSRPLLPAPSVDTGAGLERISAVLQGVPSNFDTDLFAPILARVVDVVGLPYDRGPAGASYRVLADHARAVAFLLADGVYPTSEGRGYVLRRILRRAVRHAWLLGRREPTLVN
jgi:alanyl-tRNA synthetase